MSFRREFRAVPIREGQRYRSKRQRLELAGRWRSRGKKVALFLGAAGVGAIIGLLTIPRIDGSSLGGNFFRGIAEHQGLVDAEGNSTWAWYRNCRQARAAGVAPMRRGDPGYRAGLDADDDGVACEPYYGS